MGKNFELTQQLEHEQALRSVGLQPPASPSREAPRRSNSQKRWAGEEALRLVQQIFFLQDQSPPRVVVFAGIDHGNGCSQMCVSVAEILARNARGPVCLVDANFRSPALPELFGTTNHRGLTDALIEQAPINSFTRMVTPENLWLLSSGGLAADSPNLLASEHLRERMVELRQGFDFVMIDAPPLIRYSDAVVLGQLSDGLVLVLEADATRRESASAVAANLRSAKVPILAAVLNKRTFPIPQKIYSRL